MFHSLLPQVNGECSHITTGTAMKPQRVLTQNPTTPGIKPGTASTPYHSMLTDSTIHLPLMSTGPDPMSYGNHDAYSFGPVLPPAMVEALTSTYISHISMNPDRTDNNSHMCPWIGPNGD